MSNLPELQQKANLVRKWCLISTTEAGSGHPTSCLSAADIATVLFDSYFTYDLKNPLHANNDRFILSKGHAAPLLYTLFAMSGAYPLEELKTLRKFTSRLEGHPTPHYPYAEAATGSLGQGLSVGVGMAYLAKKENRPFKTYVMLGDGEMAEGQVWEAANLASYYHLDNLIVLADVNRLAQSQETMFGHHTEKYAERFKAFGFETVVVEGHDFISIDNALKKAVAGGGGKPFAIIAQTFKGRGVSFLEDQDSWHGKALKKEDLEKALSQIGDVNDSLRFSLKTPPAAEPAKQVSMPPVQVPYKKGEEKATREVYGEVLARLGDYNEYIYALDGDVKNSTYSEGFLKVHPDRFIECFIAEQNMVSMAVGLSRLGKIPFVSTFAAFLTRAYDQIRMARISGANISFAGSHAGVSIGEDGPSQMGLEDIAMFGAIPDSLIFHPSDAVSMAKILSHLVKHVGISYVRTLRAKTPVIYEPSEEFPIGGSKTLRQSQNDLLTVVATGITVHEAVKAADTLAKENIHIRVIDAYSLKPIDVKTLQLVTTQTKKPLIITVEDHFEHGGLGDLVLSAVSETNAKVHKLAVRKLSRSGVPDELLEDAGINDKHIMKAVKNFAA